MPWVKDVPYRKPDIVPATNRAGVWIPGQIDIRQTTVTPIYLYCKCGTAFLRDVTPPTEKDPYAGTSQLLTGSVVVLLVIWVISLILRIVNGMWRQIFPWELVSSQAILAAENVMGIIFVILIIAILVVRTLSSNFQRKDLARRKLPDNVYCCWNCGEIVDGNQAIRSTRDNNPQKLTVEVLKARQAPKIQAIVINSSRRQRIT